MKLYLKDMPAGTQSIFFNTGEDAKAYIEGLSSEKPHVVVLDLNLPRLSGYDLYPIIRKSMGNDVPVVIFSSSNSDVDKSKASKMGANRYIVKPDNIADYQHAVRDIYQMGLEAAASI